MLSIHRRGHVVPPMGALHGLYGVHCNVLAVALVARVCGCNLIRLDVGFTLLHCGPFDCLVYKTIP